MDGNVTISTSTPVFNSTFSIDLDTDNTTRTLLQTSHTLSTWTSTVSTDAPVNTTQFTITNVTDAIVRNVTGTTSLSSTSSAPSSTTVSSVTSITDATQLPTTVRTLLSTKSETTTLFIYEEHSDDITIVTGILVPIIIVIILLAVFIFYQKYWKQRKYKKRRSDRTKVSFNDNPIVTGAVIKSPHYSDSEEYNTNVFDELPDKQDGFVTIDLSEDNNDSKKPNGGGINIVNSEASNNIVNQSLESICEKEEFLIENDEDHDQQLQNNKHNSDLPSNHDHEHNQSESESNTLKDKDKPSGQHVSDNTSGQHVSDNNKHDVKPGDTNSITCETEEITKM